MGVLPYEGERFRGSVGILRGVSERVERERALQRREDRYRSLLGRNLVALYVARDGDLVYHNEAFAAPFDRPAEANAFVGESLVSLVVPADRERLTRALRRVETGVADGVRQPYVAVTAEDGPGIPTADRERIFESGLTTTEAGTRFGLAIVAEMAEAHGWRVAATAARWRHSDRDPRRGAAGRPPH